MSLQTLHEGRWLKLVADGRWEYVVRTHVVEAVAIVAVNSQSELLLVEQFRVPLGRPCIELPAGLVGDEAEHVGEGLDVAASRELLEETGYQAQRLEALCSGPSSAGLTSEVIHFFRAVNVQRVHAGGGVAGENITLHEVPLDGIVRWLAAKTAAGVMLDYKIYVALHFLRAGEKPLAAPTGH